MRRLYKYLSITLLIILFAFNGKSSYALMSNDTLIKNYFKLDKVNSFDSIIESLDTYDNMSLIPIINNYSSNNYIEFGEKYIFRIKDNSLQLIELTPTDSKVINTITLNNMYVQNLYLMNNYLIVAGDELNNFSAINSPFNILSSTTSIKILNIEDLSNIETVKDISISGNLVEVILSDNHLTVFSKYKPYNNTLNELGFLPYYFEDNKKSYFNFKK